MNPEADVMIANLKKRLELILPGDSKRIDFYGFIQEIEASCLGGNDGHAMFLMRYPEERLTYDKSIEEKYRELMN